MKPPAAPHGNLEAAGEASASHSAPAGDRGTAGIEETAFLFDCAGEASVGIVSQPQRPRHADTGLLIVVGGPQYRVGSHRLFVRLARHAAHEGMAAMRFDYRGMGDSWAEPQAFDAVEDDLRHAIDAFQAQVPGLKRVVLWGLCDGASAACLYAPQDPRVAGVVLVNPWARTPEGEASTRLRHYYLRRLRSRAFWLKLVSGRVSWRASSKALARTLRQSLASRLKGLARRAGLATPSGRRAGSPGAPAKASAASLPDRMAQGLSQSAVRFAIALSGDDKVAREFEDRAMPTPTWRALLQRQLLEEVVRIEHADHTVTEAASRQLLCERSVNWACRMAVEAPTPHRP